MEPDFWHARWEKNQIGFHEGAPNALLQKYFARLSLGKGARVFVPLCGKTRDISWLLAQGFRVVGAELSAIATEQLFEELGVAPVLSSEGALARYSAPALDILAGDIFDVSRTTLGPVDAIYDRAALVALPEEMRARYAAHLMAITATAPQFLICFAYDQTAMDGPPFCVSDEDVRTLYGDSYQLTLLERVDIPGGMKGQCDATEHAWLLSRR